MLITSAPNDRQFVIALERGLQRKEERRKDVKTSLENAKRVASKTQMQR